MELGNTITRREFLIGGGVLSAAARSGLSQQMAHMPPMPPAPVWPRPFAFGGPSLARRQGADARQKRRDDKQRARGDHELWEGGLAG